jgi:hypothetical protein
MNLETTYLIYNYTINTKRWQTIFYATNGTERYCIKTVHPMYC